MEKLEWHNDRRRVGDLIPYEHNPRILTEKQAKDLEKSLKKFNLVEVPAVNTDGKIIAGHQRIKTLIALGRENDIIDIRVPNRPLTDSEYKEYNVRSNKNVADWDFGKLSDEFDLGDLKEWGFEDNNLGMFSVDGVTAPQLSSEQQHDYQQMTFILHNDQAERVKSAISEASKKGFSESEMNENKNGNALAYICTEYLRNV